MELLNKNNEEITVKDTNQPFIMLLPREPTVQISSQDIRQDILRKAIENVDIPSKKAAMTINFSIIDDIYCYDVYFQQGQPLSKQTIDAIFLEIRNAHVASFSNLKGKSITNLSLKFFWRRN